MNNPAHQWSYTNGFVSTASPKTIEATEHALSQVFRELKVEMAYVECGKVTFGTVKNDKGSNEK